MRPTTDLQRTVAPIRVVSDFQPSGDQPTAITDLSQRIQRGEQDLVLLGATGTGKTYTAFQIVDFHPELTRVFHRELTHH